MKINSKMVLILILFCVTEVLHPQSITWQRLYNNHDHNDNGVGICLSDSGNIFAVGYSSQAGPNGIDILVIKLKPNGDTIWGRTYGDHRGIQSFACVSSGDGGCVITGAADSAYFLKIDRNGNLAWERYLNDIDVILFDIIKTSDNGYLACGRIAGTNLDGYVIKLDSSGNLQWRRIFPAKFYVTFNSVIEMGNQYVLAGDESETSTTPIKGILVKLDLNGETKWKKEYLLYTYFTNFVKINNKDNGYLVCGSTADSMLNRTQTFLAKFDTSGVIYYSKLFYYFSQEYLQEVRILGNGNYVFASDVDSTTGRNAKVYITDTLGNVSYQRIFCVTDYTLLRSIMALPKNDIIFIGTVQTYLSSRRDVFVVRTDSTLYTKPLAITSKVNTFEKDYTLFQNYPNPFNSSTMIKIEINFGSFVNLEVFDLSGKLVRKLITNKYIEGEFFVVFNGDYFPTGIYFYRLSINNKPIFSKKMILIK